MNELLIKYNASLVFHFLLQLEHNVKTRTDRNGRCATSIFDISLGLMISIKYRISVFLYDSLIL